MREKITQTLVTELRKHESVLGCFEGGSASFGRNDEWSDLDLQILVKDDFVEQTVQILEGVLESIAPFETRYILPSPTWHRQWQGFYQLKGISPYLIMDVLIMKESSPSYFTEVEQHGTPIIFFDKTGRIGQEHINKEEMRQTISRRINRIANLRNLTPVFVDKEINRNMEIDAFDTYYNLLLRSLVELLRIKYDAARWSWGFKYLCHVLPLNVYNEVKTLSYVSSIKDLEQKKKLVQRYIDALLKENLYDNLSL